MRALPPGLQTQAVIDALAVGWGLDVETADYAALGAGSYHWIVWDANGTRRFVTVDDLDHKSWLGDTRDSVLEGLRRAFDTAAALRAGGLEFVVAPLPTLRGETLLRLGASHTIALFPFVDGQAGEYGRYDPGVPAAIASMLAELHFATPAAASVAGTIGVDLPGRHRLEAGLRELDEAWSGGPLSEPARDVFSRHAPDVAAFLALADRLAAAVAARKSAWVVTHGEPHAANVMRTRAGHVLVDWDTVALAPRERDLWMLAEAGAEDLAVYTEATRHELDREAVDFFRLSWDLRDLAEYLNVVRSPHAEDEDTLDAYEGLTRCVPSRERWSRLL